MNTKSFVCSFGLLLALMLAGGLYSVLLGQDVNWDLLNYHLYNPFAFLNGKIGHDFMAAGVHSCLNPLPDVYFYLLFKQFFNAPRWIAFFMGLPYGVLGWALYGLAKEVFAQTAYPRWLAAAAAGIGATAAGIMSQIGMTTNEIPLAVLNLLALWLVLRWARGKGGNSGIYWSAFLSGLAAGMKLTAAPYCLALFAAAVCARRIRHPFKTFGLFALSGLAGFLAADGYFLWKWYTLYGNPVFPFYNQIFHSPFFDPIYLTETRFFPTTWLQWLFYPFYWAFSPAALAGEVPVHDMRLAAAFVGAFVWAVQIWRQKAQRIFGRAAAAVLVYVVTGYVLWLTQFSILRYAAVVEALSGVLLVGACVLMCKNRWNVYTAWGLLGLLLLGYEVPDWRHEDYQRQAVVFDRKPRVEDDALVFFMHLPSSYLAPLLNPKAAYMGGFYYHPEDYPPHERARAARRNNLQPQYFRFQFEETQQRKIASHQGPLYLVSIDWPELVNSNALKRFGLKGKLANCSSFITNWTIYSPRLAICRVEKEESAAGQ